MKKLIIVTAEPTNFVPKALDEAAKSLNIESSILDINHVVLIEAFGEDSHKSKIFTVDEIKEGEEKRKELKLLEIGDNTVIIPRLNEYHLDVKLSILKRMESSGATLYNTIEGMDLCNDKLMTHVVLNDSGIKSPKTFTMTNVDDIEITVDTLEKEGNLKYPIVIKTLRGTHGIGVMKLDSRASLVSVGQTLQKEGMDFIVQEFMEHDQSARMIMSGDNLLAANLRGQPKNKGEFRTNSHLGSETEPYEPSEDEIALGRRIVEIFGTKFCAIDYLIIDKEGQKEFVILEVNGSPGLENIQKNWPDRNLALDVVKSAVQFQETSTTVEQPTQEITPEPEQNLPQDFVGEVEIVSISRVTDDLEGRVDTGAKYCSLHVDSVEELDGWVRFKRNDIVYKIQTERSIKIKNVHAGESVTRPLVRLDITIKGQKLNGVEFTLNSRNNMKYEVLIGRNALERLGLPVVVPQNTEHQDYPETEVSVEEE